MVQPDIDKTTKLVEILVHGGGLNRDGRSQMNIIIIYYQTYSFENYNKRRFRFKLCQEKKTKSDWRQLSCADLI